MQMLRRWSAKRRRGEGGRSQSSDQAIGGNGQRRGWNDYFAGGGGRRVARRVGEIGFGSRSRRGVQIDKPLRR